jgi:hypothetical protein
VVVFQFWWIGTVVVHQDVVSRTETHCLPKNITGQFGGVSEDVGQDRMMVMVIVKGGQGGWR